MRWTKSLLVLALVAVPLLPNAQTRGREAAGDVAEAQPAVAAPAQPTARKSLMGMVMGALIQSAELTQRQEALARSARPNVTGADHRSGAETPTVAAQVPIAQETLQKESVALQADDIP